MSQFWRFQVSNQQSFDVCIGEIAPFTSVIRMSDIVYATSKSVFL